MIRYQIKTRAQSEQLVYMNSYLQKMMTLLLSTIYSCLLVNVQCDFINFVTGSSINFFAPFCPPRVLQDNGIRWKDDSGSGVHYTNIADVTYGLKYQLGRDDDFLRYCSG